MVKGCREDATHSCKISLPLQHARAFKGSESSHIIIFPPHRHNEDGKAVLNVSCTAAYCLLHRARTCSQQPNTLSSLFQVFQGILLACEDRFEQHEPKDSGSATASMKYTVSLWAHECSRVFSDKMTSHDDKSWVDSTINQLAK